MPFDAGQRVFVDESKSRGYLIAAAAAVPHDVAAIEKQLRALRRGGRSSLHFNDEGNRRDLILRELTQMDVSVTVYRIRGVRDTVARPALLRALVTDMVKAGARDLVLERDESVDKTDRRVIRDRLEQLGALGTLTYAHRGRTEQPMLWIADAVAWCQQAGGAWPDKVAAIVADRVEVSL